MADFHALKWKFEDDSTVIREFFVKNHRAPDKTADKPEDRTVVMLNIPPFVTEAALRHVVSRFGGVERIVFHKHLTAASPDHSTSEFFPNADDKPITTYKVAYVVFRSPKSPGKLLAFADSDHSPFVMSTVEMPIETGLSVWTKEHRKPLLSLVDLKKEIDTYMENYDSQVESTKRQAKETEGAADEEGWVTVTRVGKKRGARQTDVLNTTTEADAKKKASEKELLNFYKFQKGGGKLKELGELRKKFEEDKLKVSQMKAARKFKPY